MTYLRTGREERRHFDEQDRLGRNAHDFGAAYDLPDCVEFARAIEPYRIFWLEEPLHWYLQPADFARLAAATPIPLAHGERD